MKRPILLASVLVAWSAVSYGASLQVVVQGSGKPVVLIPGLSCSSEVWKETAAHLNSEGFQTYAVTLPGFGGNGAIPPDNYLNEVTTDLVRYIQNNHIDKPVLIGHSLGGFLALKIAARYPELPSKVISVDGLPFLAGVMSPGATPESAKAMGQQVERAMASSTEEQYRQQARQSLQTMITAPENIDREYKVDILSDRADVAAAMAQCLSTDLRPAMANIKVPVLVLGSWIAYKNYGATHAGVEAEYKSQFAADPSAQVILSDTARHFIQLDAPDWFYAQVDTFLKTR